MSIGSDGRRQPVHPGWRRAGRSLVRDVFFRDFDQALAFVERVAHEAEDHLRRPDMCILEFNRVRLTIRNAHHWELTEGEWRLARKVDAIPLDETVPQRARPTPRFDGLWPT